MCHAEEARFGDPLLSDISEMAFAIVSVKINPGEITHNDQVQVPVAI